MNGRLSGLTKVKPCFICQSRSKNLGGGGGGGGELPEDSCEELKIASALSLIREQLKILGEKVNALEEQFKEQLFPEEPEEPEAPEDLLTMLPLRVLFPSYC